MPLRGRTQAKALVSAVAETAGIIDSVAVTKGQKVAAGDLLCTLDQGTRQAAVNQAEASLAQANAGLVQAQLDFDTNAGLREKGLAAANTSRPLEVALTSAQASLTSAQAALDNAKAELDRTEIVAKVAGVVQDPLANAGTLLAIGAPCASIVQLDPMVFIAQVPESRIGLAKIGLDASITTVTGQTTEGKVSYISATADPATRSFPIEIEIPNTDGTLRDGVTATATVNLGTAPAHLVPQSVLTLNDDGVLGVRAVEDSKAKFYPVQIASDTREGVWVLGLPAKIDIITVGQEFVNDGQPVTATNVTAAAEGTASMMNFLERILRMPRVVLTVMVLLLGAGVAAYVSLPKESFPAIDIPYFYVSVTQTGVSPRDAERLLAKPIEDRVKDIDGLENYSSTSTTGHASVFLEFNVNADKDKALNDIRAEHGRHRRRPAGRGD